MELNEFLPETSICYFENFIPREIVELIFSFLPLENLYPLQFVNKSWYVIVKEHYQTKRQVNWGWSTTKKDPSVAILEKENIVIRPTAIGKNPGIFSNHPLTKKFCHFRIKILKLAKWFGVGIADSSCLTTGKTLGTQPVGVNSAYFWQDNGISRLQMYGEENIDADTVSAGGFIDVKVNFSENQVSYWINNKYQGSLTCTKFTMKEGEIFACVNLSSGTSLQFQNNVIPILDSTVHEDIIEEEEEDFEIPPSPFPTNWKWDDNPKKKAPVIELDETKLIATRKNGGHNPAVLAVLPFTRNSCYFQVKLIHCSKWLGIGIADRKLRLNGSRTLGNQRRGFNASYFWQKNRSNNLQTYGEKTKIVSPLQDGDIIGIRVDFDAQLVYYYRNQLLEGTVTCVKRRMEEGKVYPCVDLSIGSEVKIINVETCPQFLKEHLNILKS